MYVVIILEAAHEDLRNIVAYISNENPDAAENTFRRSYPDFHPPIAARKVAWDWILLFWGAFRLRSMLGLA
jgi:plasmid stabilization system protein ParE